jgi:hypothetical protein
MTEPRTGPRTQPRTPIGVVRGMRTPAQTPRMRGRARYARSLQDDPFTACIERIERALGPVEILEAQP